MATNRYDEISVSNFSPLSLEELMLVPAMKRKQHDANLLALQNNRLKLDPLQVHSAEALRLKQEMDARIDEQTNQLNKEGINPNTIDSVIKLNREYQDLIAPTGRAGQINNAKVVRDKNFQDYLEDATKNKGFSREDALWNWYNEHEAKYTGYDDNNGIKNIDPYGAPKRLVLQEDLKTVKSLLGENTQTLMRNNGFNFQEGPNGSIVVMDGRGRLVETSNYPQLKEAAQYLESRWLNKTGEGTASARFERMDPDRVLNEINNGLGMMKSYKLEDTRETDYSIQGYSAKIKPEEIPDLEAVNVEAVNVSANSDLLSKLDGTFVTATKPIEIVAARAGVDQDLRDEKTRKIIKDRALESPEYRKLANSLSKTNPNLQGKNFKSPEMQKAVQTYLEQNRDVVIQNRYVDPNTNKQGMLFASKELTGEDSKEKASSLILERVRRGAYDMVDEEGNLIDKNDVGNFDFVYSGDMTPKSQIGNKFRNPKQNIGARTGILVNKETGESKTVYVSRSKDDFNTPQFKAMETISGISKIADIQPNIYHEVKDRLFTQYGLKNVEIKYNKNKDTYNIRYEEDGIKHHAEYDDASFQEFILESYQNLK